VNADELIFGEPIPSTRSATDWDVIVDRLVTTFATTLGMQLKVDHRAVIDQQALTCRVMTTESVGGPLRLGLTATVGIDTVDGKPFVDAAVFAFSGTVRLDVDHYAAFRYRQDGKWEYKGWVKDVYGEFRGWPPPH
jgi:hypothetical protein